MKIVIIDFPDDTDITHIKAGDKADIRVNPKWNTEGKILAVINTASLSEMLSQL